MPNSEDNLIAVLTIGTLVVVTLLIFLFLFVIIYQRRMIKNQVQLRALEDQRQNDLMRSVFETQEAERKRLAEDLHDSVGQVLSAIKLNLHRLENLYGEEHGAKDLLVNTQKLTDESINEIRDIIHNVLPPLLTSYGLFEAVKDLCVRIEHTTGIEVSLTMAATERQLEPETEVSIFRIVQELFGNAIRHSKATSIFLDIGIESNKLLIQFTDNGIGFDMAAIKHGAGLKNLESRARFIHAELHIVSAPNSGTTTHVKVNLS